MPTDTRVAASRVQACLRASLPWGGGTHALLTACPSACLFISV